MKKYREILMILVFVGLMLCAGALNQVQLFGWNGTSWTKQISDSVTDAGVTIEYEHHELHNGSSFTVQYQGEVTNTNEQTVIAITTPDTVKFHMLVIATSDDSASFMICETTAMDVNEGTASLVYNRDRNSDSNSTVLNVRGDPNIGYVDTYDEIAAASANIDANTVIYHEDIGETGNPQTSSGGGTRGIYEFILKQNTEYAFILNAENSNTQVHNIILNWYEHTDHN